MRDADTTAIGLSTMDIHNVSQFLPGDEAPPFAVCVRNP